MKVRVEWIPSQGVATIFHQGVALADEAAIAAWKAALFPQLERFVDRFGRKLPLLICLDGLTIQPAVADRYGQVAKEIVERFVTVWARYGEAGRVRPIIALEALKQGYRANLFESRAEALSYVRARHRDP